MTITINGTQYGLSQLINMTDGEILDLVYELVETEKKVDAIIKIETLLEWAKTGGTPNAMAN